jgi:uncharacterized protein DUF6602
MTKPDDHTNLQGWMRDHSDLLAVSFKSSGRIKHNVTKGESREHQILDTLSNLLPTRTSVESKVVIVDAADAQSPQFDGALVDRILWPRLFAYDNTTGVMLDSVFAAIEVKSSLDKSEMMDIFSKAAALRKMLALHRRPLVTAFAYECANPNLSFFDFSTSFLQSPDHSPSLVCVLNQSVFGLARFDTGEFLPVDEPRPDAIPVLFITRQDTLLMYLYFLSRWATSGTRTADLFMRYSTNLFSSIASFHFDADFLGAMATDPTALALARRCFERKPNVDIDQLYAEARNKIGLH